MKIYLILLFTLVLSISLNPASLFNSLCIIDLETTSTIPNQIFTSTPIPETNGSPIETQPSPTETRISRWPPTRTLRPTITPYIIVEPLKNEDTIPMIVLAFVAVFIVLLGLWLNRRSLS